MTKEGRAHAARRAGIPLVASLYSRVSEDDSDDQRSVQEQDEENHEVCDTEGWVVGEVYCDNDKSASRFATKQREDWERLLEDLPGGRSHLVVLWEPSRGDRRLAHWIGFLDQCRDLGLLIHITSHQRTYDPRKRRDYKTLAEEGMDSHDDSEKTSERVQRTKRKSASKGLPAGRHLYGYTRIYEVGQDGKKRLVRVVFDEEVRTAVAQDGTVHEYTHAGVVRDIVERLASGDSLRSVAVDLNRRNIPTSRNGKWGWYPTRLREIATNPAYVGQRVHQGAVLPDVKTMWEPLVPMEQFQACVARFSRADRNAHRDGAALRLLTGIATCGVCGRVVRRMGSPDSPTYVCAPDSRSGFGPTTGYCVSRKIAAVDRYVERSVWIRLARPDLVKLLRQDKRADDRLAQFAADIAEKRALLDDARERCTRGSLSLDSLERLEGTLLPQIEVARQRMNETRIAPVLRGFVGRPLAEIEAEWQRRSVAQRREVIRVLTESIEILPLGGGRKKYRPEESVRVTWWQPPQREDDTEADPGG